MKTPTKEQIEDVIYPSRVDIQEIREEMPVPHARFLDYLNPAEVESMFFCVINLWEHIRKR